MDFWKGDVQMYQLGDRIVYGVHGVCDIIDLEIRVIDRKKVEYFVLSPLDQPEARFYVPTQNKAALAKLRPLVDRDSLEEILRQKKQEAPSWIPDENLRKQKYRELINKADVGELVCMVRDLHIHRQAQIEQGRKFHLCDENFLRDAEKLLCAEFSLVLNIPQNEVKGYIHT